MRKVRHAQQPQSLPVSSLTDPQNAEENVTYKAQRDKRQDRRLSNSAARMEANRIRWPGRQVLIVQLSVKDSDGKTRQPAIQGTPVIYLL